MFVNSLWKSGIWKGAVVRVGSSMLVVVMKFMGAMDMEFIITCELMPNSTGDCNGPPYEAVKSALMVMAPCA